jgi:uncharacterized membrane protein
MKTGPESLHTGKRQGIVFFMKVKSILFLIFVLSVLFSCIGKNAGTSENQEEQESLGTLETMDTREADEGIYFYKNPRFF